MELQQFYERFGKEHTERLLDLILISKSRKEEDWLPFMKELGLMGKGTKYCFVFKYPPNRYRDKTHLQIENGVYQVRLQLNYDDNDIQRIVGVLRSETN